MPLIWLTNDRDYRREEYRREIPVLRTVLYVTRANGTVDVLMGPMGRVEWDEWTRDKVIGRPRGSSTYSSERLAGMGVIGIYKEMSWWKAAKRGMSRLWRFLRLRAPVRIVGKELRLLWRKLWRSWSA